MALTPVRLSSAYVEDFEEHGQSCDHVVLSDGDTYSSASGSLLVADGCAYDLQQIINFYFDNATIDMLEGIKVQELT